jgi:formylglycine-generating enzyme required for sulfatase activity
LPSRGVVRSGTTQVKVGDKLRPENLGGLSYWAEPGTTGDVGALTYVVDDGRGGKTTGKLNVQITGIDDRITTETDLWQRIYERGSIEDIDSFMRVFPESSLIEAAKQRRSELVLAKSKPPAPMAAATPGPASSVAPSPAPSLATATPAPDTKVASAASQRQSNAGLIAPARGTGQTTFQDCALCPVMVKVPAGTFMMGQASDPTTQPVRRVSIAAMALGQHPVTVAEWDACFKDNGCNFTPRMANASGETPVHNLSWEDTQQYIVWLSNKTGRKYRLPSEAEWEYAARAGTTTAYWWGETLGASLANCVDCGGEQDRTKPLAVESFKANPFGLFDMSGGVSQLVADCWIKDYAGAPTTGAAREQKGCQAHVLRGGSFRSAHDAITVYARSFYDASVRYLANGFRVASDSAK